MSDETGPAESPGFDRPWRGRLLVTLAATLWSTSGLFAKAPWLAGWPVEERGWVLAFWRALFAGLVLLPFTKRRRLSLSLLPAGICFAAMNVAFLSSLTRCGESTALWLQYTAPLWVFLAGLVLGGEKARGIDIVMVVGIAFGVGIIAVPQVLSVAVSPVQQWGVAMGLASGMALAGVFLTLRRLRGWDSAWIVAFCHLFAAACAAPLALGGPRWPEPREFGWLATFGILQMAIPYVLFSRGLRRIPAHEGSCLALIEPLLVSLWVYLAWGHRADYQPPTVATLIGGGVILLSLLGNYLYRPIREPRMAPESGGLGAAAASTSLGSSDKAVPPGDRRH